MKNIFIMVFSFMVLVTLGGWAHAASQKVDQSTDVSSAKARIKATGIVSNDGKKFIADKDKKEWTIDNPDAVKADAGHHVRLEADETPTDTLHVRSVKMMDKGKAATPSNSK
jgi:hypothetical protein